MRTVVLLAVNIGAALAGVLAFGLWQRGTPPHEPDVRYEGTITHGYNVEDDDLGFVPASDRRVTVRKIVDGQLLYDVAYTTGVDRFRIVPPSVAQPRACVLLFGDSLTFGEGVEDWDTFAWKLVDRSKGEIAVHNFAVSGYGPHQMLSGLQSGLFARSIDCKPTHAVYLFIPEHIARVGGRVAWGGHGPHYVLENGRPVRRGHFDDPPGLPPPPDLDEGFLSWRRLLGVRSSGTPQEAELTAAIIVEAARELDRLAPGIKLHVLFWTTFTDARLELVAERLKAAGIVVHPVDAIIAGYAAHWQDYVISPLDLHPSAATHTRIADFIAHEIVAKGR